MTSPILKVGIAGPIEALTLLFVSLREELTVNWRLACFQVLNTRQSVCRLYDSSDERMAMILRIGKQLNQTSESERVA